MTDVVLVANPASGSSDRAVLNEVREVVAALGRVHVVEPAAGETFDRAVDGAVGDGALVVVAGGDGTIHRAVNALRARLDDLSLGVVPMGTGNDFARTLGLPTAPVEAARAIVRGTERALDLGRARGEGVTRLFVNACMGGFPVEVNQAIGDELKRRLGPAAFWVGGAKAAAGLTRTSVTMNDVRLSDCVAAGVGNGKTCGGGIMIWPSASPDDGRLDGCALGAGNHAQAVKLAAKIKGGSHEELESVATTRDRSITISSDPPIEINVDGELIGLTTPATFEIAGRLRVRV